MKRRTVIAVAAVLTAGVLTGAGALAFGGPPHRHGMMKHGMMKRFVSMTIDDALDRATATPEQRSTIHAARDRVFAAVEQQWESRGSRMEEVLQLFEADQVDPAQVAAFRQAREEERRRLGDTIEAAIVEAHATLTPAQRKIVADYVRSRY
jgi:Spy/CpxP family protein refolding chaperone